MRRRGPRLPPPQPKAPQIPSKPTAPLVHRDDRGREWVVTYLFKGQSSYGETRPWDATHRGFAWENLRVVYRFQPGDDRGTDPERLRSQFESGRRLSTPLEHAMRQKPYVLPVTKDQRLLELYDRRGMGRR